jgi:hypothetical protein
MTPRSAEDGILHTRAEPRCTVILFWPFTITLLIVGFILRFWCVNAP